MRHASVSGGVASTIRHRKIAALRENLPAIRRVT
jgi:hypothetical protein